MNNRREQVDEGVGGRLPLLCPTCDHKLFFQQQRMFAACVTSFGADSDPVAERTYTCAQCGQIFWLCPMLPA